MATLWAWLLLGALLPCPALPPCGWAGRARAGGGSGGGGACAAALAPDGAPGTEEAGLLLLQMRAMATPTTTPPGTIPAKVQAAMTDVGSYDNDVNADQDNTTITTTVPGTIPAVVQAAMTSVSSYISSRYPDQTNHNTDGLVGLCIFKKKRDCPLERMSRTITSTAVYPDHTKWGTGCVDSDSPFQFQVFPGKNNKLVIYFQSGGLCWDQVSVDQGLCRTGSRPQTDHGGIFNRTASENPYRNFTIVLVTSCSGDAHTGNATQSFTFSGKVVKQLGYRNTKTAIKWMNVNMAPKLKQLVIMGDSTGSLSVEKWAWHLLKRFTKGRRTVGNSRVTLDSWVELPLPGVGTNALANIWKSDTCGGRESTACFVTAMDLFQDTPVPFTSINSKADLLQNAFITIIAWSLGSTTVELTAEEFYRAVIAQWRIYSIFSNWIGYFVDGEQHGFTSLGPCTGRENCTGSVYDARPSGPLDRANADGGKPMIAFVAKRKGKLKPECYGSLSNPLPGFPFSLNHCSEIITSKAGIPVR